MGKGKRLRALKSDPYGNLPESNIPVETSKQKRERRAFETKVFLDKRWAQEAADAKAAGDLRWDKASAEEIVGDLKSFGRSARPV
jgi:hypothetical protein